MLSKRNTIDYTISSCQLYTFRPNGLVIIGACSNLRYALKAPVRANVLNSLRLQLHIVLTPAILRSARYILLSSTAIYTVYLLLYGLVDCVRSGVEPASDGLVV